MVNFCLCVMVFYLLKIIFIYVLSDMNIILGIVVLLVWEFLIDL